MATWAELSKLIQQRLHSRQYLPLPPRQVVRQPLQIVGPQEVPVALRVGDPMEPKQILGDPAIRTTAERYFLRVGDVKIHRERLHQRPPTRSPGLDQRSIDVKQQYDHCRHISSTR